MIPALEIRLIAYGLAAFLIVGGSGWGGYTLASHHYERITASERLAQVQALSQAQDRVIAAQKAQKAAEMKVEQAHEEQTQADTASRDAVLSSVRGLETAIHRQFLPAAMANSGAVQAAEPGTGSDQRLASLVDRFNASLERLIFSCQGVDSDRTAILHLEPTVTP